jgi:hypothetical protein
MPAPLDPDTEPTTTLDDERVIPGSLPAELEGYRVRLRRREDSGEWALELVAPNNRIVLSNGEGEHDEDEGWQNLRYAQAQAEMFFPGIPVVIEGDGEKIPAPKVQDVPE